MALVEFRSSPVIQQISDLPGFTEVVTMAASGATVNRITAMRLAAVYACVKALSDDLAGLPVNVFRKTNDGKVEKVNEHPAQERVKLTPNPEMTAFSWKKARIVHVLLNGNSYSLVERSMANPVKFIWPLDPDSTVVERVKNPTGGRGRLRYRTMDGYHTKIYEAEDIIHLKGFSWGGVVGDSVITNYARDQIGIGLDMGQFQSAFFRNGLNPGGVFEHPATFGKGLKDNFIEAVKKRFGGSKNSHLPMVLEEGMTFKPYEVKMVDQQFLDLLKVNKVDICGIFGVPQSRISISDANTNYNNTEQEKQRYYQSGLLPWAIPDEQELSLRLLTDAERKEGLYVKYNFDAFLRGDSKTRAEVNQIYHRMGVPLNTLLAQDDRNPVDGGDVGLAQISMAPVKDLGDIQKAKFMKNTEPARADGEPVKEKKGLFSFLSGRELRTGTLTEDEKEIQGLVKLEKVFRKKIFKTAGALVARECDQIEEQIDLFFGSRSNGDFITWLDEFYKGFPEDVVNGFAPVLKQYADMIRHESGRMAGGISVLTDDMVQFTTSYLDTYAIRHCGSSMGQIKGLVAATDPEDLYDVLMKRIEEWRETRADKIADDETIRIANAVARESWRQMGVTKLKWVTQGSNVCPFCKQLAGKIVCIRDPFLDKDDVLTGKDAKGNYMRIKGRKSHPPIHKGCVCAILPMTETRAVFNQAGANDFVRQRDLLPADMKAFVTPYTALQYEKKKISLFLAASGLAGFGLTPEKELVSVFSLPGASQGKFAVENAVKAGARKLDCFDTILVDLYGKFGFEESGRMQWDDQYAPDGWDYDKFGRPDIVFMERKDKKSQDPGAYKKDKGIAKSKPGTIGNKGSDAFQKHAEDFVEQTFGKDMLDTLKK